MLREVIPGQKLLVVGMGSKSDMPLFEKVSLDGMTIDDFMHSKDIKVYHQATNYGGHSPDYLITSIHRMTDVSIRYAQDMQTAELSAYKLVAVLAGGLAFQLPGVMAAKSAIVPIVAVPTDIDAFYNTHKIPDGTPVGSIEIGNLEKGLRMAERILNYKAQSDDGELKKVNLIVSGNCSSADNVRKFLKEFIGDFNEPEYQEHYDGLTICLSDSSSGLLDLDARVDIGIFGLEKNIETLNAIATAKYLSNSIMIGRPVNLALYAARIVGLSNRSIVNKLLDFRQNEAKNYPAYQAIQPDIDFV